MAELIPMTALSPTMEEGTIVSWSVKEGDSVSSGDVLCEVETDKTSVEYESAVDGTILKIIVGVGGSAAVGQSIAVIGESGEDIADLLKEAESDSGASTAEDSSPSPPRKEAAPETQETGQEAPPAAPPKQQPVVSASASPAMTATRIKASPLAVKLAAERNINLALVKGSGTGGRIVKQDVENFRGVPGGAGAVTGASSGVVSSVTDETIPVTGKRGVIAKRLSESKFSAPHYYLKNGVNMGQVLAARSLLNKGRNEKVSLNAFFIKLAAEALKRHPGINASWQGDSILQFGSIDIGLAVDVGNGLITPVVRNCGNRGIIAIEADLVQLIEKARSGSLKPDEYTGATFTISNLGSFGVEEFTAIINPPGSAILALGATVSTPIVADSGSIEVAPIMKMTLSCDHRVIDGAAGGRFLADLKGLMEQPARLLF
jgi:pyruvate dehydrogenase E2 component (dihydrolipoamide acetyltransferase)